LFIVAQRYGFFCECSGIKSTLFITYAFPVKRARFSASGEKALLRSRQGVLGGYGKAYSPGRESAPTNLLKARLYRNMLKEAARLSLYGNMILWKEIDAFMVKWAGSGLQFQK